jgi:hypothetical protein
MSKKGKNGSVFALFNPLYSDLKTLNLSLPKA